MCMDNFYIIFKFTFLGLCPHFLLKIDTTNYFLLIQYHKKIQLIKPTNKIVLILFCKKKKEKER